MNHPAVAMAGDLCNPIFLSAASDSTSARVDSRLWRRHPQYTLRVRARIEICVFKTAETNKGANFMQRKASAVWQGDLKTGKGAISTDSGTLKQTQYSFSTRFENGVGTNPEELLAAAHAGCFTMALS